MPRTRAARAIAAVIGNGITLDEALDRSCGSLEGRDRALAREIAFGVCRHYFELDALLGYLREGDTVVVHSMDRLARNLDDLRRLVADLTKRGVKIQFVKESLTFTGEDSPMSNLLLSVMGAFAEFERALIRERQREGVALAKQRGAYKGRKKTLSAQDVATVKKRIAEGETKAKVARDLGLSRETLYQYLRQP